MEITRIHPYIESPNPAAARDFYVDVFGLDVAMDQPVVNLASTRTPSAQLIIIPKGMETAAPDFGIDVGDAAAVDVVHERVVASGRRIVYPLTIEPWGVRRFFFEDPDGRIVNVLAHIGPAG